MTSRIILAAAAIAALATAGTPPSAADATTSTIPIPHVPHALAGTWAGTGYRRGLIKVHIPGDEPRDGEWCFVYPDRSMLTGTLTRATVHENRILWEQSKIDVRLILTNRTRRQAKFWEQSKTGVISTRLKPAMLRPV